MLASLILSDLSRSGEFSLRSYLISLRSTKISPDLKEIRQLDLFEIRPDLIEICRDLFKIQPNLIEIRQGLFEIRSDPTKISRFRQNSSTIFAKSSDNSHSPKSTETRPETDDIRAPELLPSVGRRVQV